MFIGGCTALVVTHCANTAQSAEFEGYGVAGLCVIRQKASSIDTQNQGQPCLQPSHKVSLQDTGLSGHTSAESFVASFYVLFINALGWCSVQSLFAEKVRLGLQVCATSFGDLHDGDISPRQVRAKQAHLGHNFIDFLVIIPAAVR